MILWPAGIIAVFRVVNRYVGNLAPMPGVLPSSFVSAFRSLPDNGMWWDLRAMALA